MSSSLSQIPNPLSFPQTPPPMAASIYLPSLFSPLLSHKIPCRIRSNLALRYRIRSALQSEPAIRFDAVSEMELRRKGFMGMRKTKLVCTVGPACCSEEELERMALAGMNLARLNMCHNTREWHRDVIRGIKKLNRDKGFCVAMMIDTEGSQMCLIDHGSDSSVKAEDGSMWLFTTEKFEGSRPFTVQLNYEEFSEGVMVGDELVIDGGMATFEVVERFGTDLRCKCTDPGLLLPRAKLSFWRGGELVGKSSGLPTLTTKDWADIEFGISEGVDFIAVSFVKDANDIKHLKNYLSRRSSEFVKVLAKIESIESLENLGDIIEASDRDHVVWSSILSACLSNSYSEQGKGLLVRYVSDGYTLDPFMFATAFSLQLHSCLSKSAFLRDLFVRSSLMDMYVSFGMADEVYRSFLECEEKNEMIFGSMIHGFVSSASYSSAIALVPDMRNTGMSMDPLILSFMIKAVTNLDMWEEGRALHGQIVKQDGESIRRGTLFQIVQVIKTEGWGGLYSGLKPSLIGTTASQGIYYFFYQVFKNKAEAIALSRKKKGLGDGAVGMFSWLVVAAIAGSINVLLTNPIWVLVTRMQTHTQAGKKILEAKKEAILREKFLQKLPSVVAARVLDPQQGERMLDMCAAPGGKTTAIAILMKNKGEIVATDRSAQYKEERDSYWKMMQKYIGSDVTSMA